MLADDSFFSPYNCLNIYACLSEFKPAFSILCLDCLISSVHLCSLTVFCLLDWDGLIGANNLILAFFFFFET